MSMRFQRLLLVVNPVARTMSKPVLAVIEKALSADFRLEVAETKERGHASELAAQATEEGIDLVVVFSGDGTINEAVNALAGTETALGVLPGGATNILVRALGLPSTVEATGVLIAKALDDQAFKLSLGVADGRYFAVNCGAGVDAAAMRRLEEKFPRPRRSSTGRPSGGRRVSWWATRAVRPTWRCGSTTDRRSVPLGHGRTHRPVHVLQGPRDPDDARGVAGFGPRRALGPQARSPSVPGSHGRCSGRLATCTAGTSTTSTTRGTSSSRRRRRSRSRSTGMRSAITAAWRWTSRPRPSGWSPNPRRGTAAGFALLDPALPFREGRPSDPHVRARRGTAAGCMARIRWTRTRGRTGDCGAASAPSGTTTCRGASTWRPGSPSRSRTGLQLVPVDDGCRRPGRGRVAPERGDPRVAASEGTEHRSLVDVAAPLGSRS